MTEQEFLNEYHAEIYERPSVTVDILVFSLNADRKLSILLTKRKEHPFLDKWSIPGGFIDMKESAEESAARKLKEKTGAENLHLEQLYTFSAVDRDPRTRVITIAYMVLAPQSKIVFNPQDAEWFTVNQTQTFSLSDGHITLLEEDMAFDHATIIRMAIERMRGKLDYTDIAFDLLNNKHRFAIFELQKIHEAILGKTIDTANFKRYVNNRYIQTDVIKQTGEQCREFSKRPSWYYTVTQ